MPYVTIMRPPGFHQMSFDDLLDGVEDISKYVIPTSTGTITRNQIHIHPKLMEFADIDGIIIQLEQFNEFASSRFEKERSTLYRSYKIRKASGGLRPIDEPLPELMNALNALKMLLETKCMVKYHTSAYAYVKNRSTVDAVKRHQQNESRWFLKLDFSNFFGSTTLEFLLSMMEQIFPFSEIVKQSRGKEALTRAMSLCFLRGGLPQGSPMSPMLTNLMMIPFDHKISNSLGKRLPYNDKYENRFVYTRYADDMHISSKYSFRWSEVQEYIKEVLGEFHAPFSINPKKTHYGSSSGKNFILGLMLNKDNEITLGHREKKNFKSMLEHFAHGYMKWDLADVRHLDGLISYYKMVERDYIEYLLKHYSKKFDLDIFNTIKLILQGKLATSPEAA